MIAKSVEKSPNWPKTTQTMFQIEKVHKCFAVIFFVNLKSNLALLYNKGHNLLTSAFPQKTCIYATH